MNFMCIFPRKTYSGILMIVCTIVLIAGCQEKKSMKQDGPPPGVLVSKIHYKDVEQSVQYIGRTTAINDVSLQAQVSGYLLDTLFEEGSDVEVGQELFTIDPDLYEAGVAAAKGNLAKAEADLVRAEKDLARYIILRKTKNISQQQVDISESEVLQKQAQVKYANAELQAAELDLSHTHIKSPIKGRIGRTLISKGNVIGPKTTSLARIVELDPIYVTFNVAEADIVEIKRQAIEKQKALNASQLQGENGARETKLKIRLILPDKSEYPHYGQIDFIDNAVDPLTGTMLVRAKFINPDSLLLPGLYVKTVLAKPKQASKLLVHASAVQEDQAGRFVMVVDPDNKVEQRRVTTGRQFGGNLIIRDGLQPDEMVVVEGIQKIRPGMLVKPKIAILPGDEPVSNVKDQ